MPDLAGFLRGFPPFDTATEDDLQRIAKAAATQHISAGTLILTAGAGPPGLVHVLHSGHVELLVEGRVVDVLGPGEIIGLPSAVADLPPGLDVRAADDLIVHAVPTEALLPVLAGREGLGYLARTVRARARLHHVEHRYAAEPELVGPLVRPVVTVDQDAPLHRVVAALGEGGLSCAVVRMRDGRLGIVTDHDLRRRVLEPAGPRVVTPTMPIGDLATVPAHTIDPTATTEDAELLLLGLGVRHLPVVEPTTGTLLGVIEDVDLLAARSRTPVGIRRALRRAASIEELTEAARGIVPAVVHAVEGGRAAQAVTGTLSALVEAALVAAIGLHLREREVPPVPFAWLVTGSVARGEATLASDLDSLLTWDGDDADPDVRSWMTALAGDVLTTLAACGLAQDSHGVRADDLHVARSVDAWHAAVRAWSAGAITDQGDIYLSALSDARPVWGHATWAPVASAIAEANQRGVTRRAMYRIATGLRPPTGFVRGLVIESSGEHAGTLDLKRGGSAPVVAIARFLAGLDTRAEAAAPVSTVARLRAAALHELITPAEARDLVEALHVVQQIRVQHQVDQVRRSIPPDDHLRPDDLSTLERRGLRDAFRVVSRLQRTLPPPTTLRD
ncbi:MAG: CBS domain-containing protein [Kineosporiaceae bacterium]|nr:CBS domain-containing protein [Kineosporiaceae bacterium]